MVVNYSLPEQSEMYVHRTGRSGRAGHTGRALSLVGPQDFTAFMALKREVDISLRLLPPVTEEELAAARLSHFYELMRETEIENGNLDAQLAKKLLADLGGVEEPAQEMTEFIARMYRFIVERVVSPKTLSLGEEMHGEGAEEPQRRRRRDSGEGRRREREPERRGRGRGGRSSSRRKR